MFNWFKKKKVDPNKMWSILQDTPDPDFLDNMINDITNGKEIDQDKFNRYMSYLTRARLNQGRKK